jgi:hypothetical protein
VSGALVGLFAPVDRRPACGAAGAPRETLGLLAAGLCLPVEERNDDVASDAGDCRGVAPQRPFGAG